MSRPADIVIEQEPIAVTCLTGRTGYAVATRTGHVWRAELWLSGKMGSVTKDGKPTEAVPVWFQKQMARATVFMQLAYHPHG